MDQDKVLAEIIRRLVAGFQPECIYLFGSQAGGNRGKDGDCDLMLVLPRLTEAGFRLVQKARRMIWDLGTATDIVIWPHQAF